MISGIAASILTIILTLLYYFAGIYWSLLSEYDAVQMFVAVVFFYVTMYYMRNELLGTKRASLTVASITALMFVNWYFWTKFITRSMNKDEAGHVRY
jgi:hypothetical protein